MIEIHLFSTMYTRDVQISFNIYPFLFRMMLKIYNFYNVGHAAIILLYMPQKILLKMKEIFFEFALDNLLSTVITHLSPTTFHYLKKELFIH